MLQSLNGIRIFKDQQQGEAYYQPRHPPNTHAQSSPQDNIQNYNQRSDPHTSNHNNTNPATGHSSKKNQKPGMIEPLRSVENSKFEKVKQVNFGEIVVLNEDLKKCWMDPSFGELVAEHVEDNFKEVLNDVERSLKTEGEAAVGQRAQGLRAMYILCDFGKSLKLIQLPLKRD